MNTERLTPEIKNTEPRTIEQLINPRELPEAGFQSYNKLTNNAAEQKAAFVSGEQIHLNLTHPRLRKLGDMDKGILSLYSAAQEVGGVESDSEKASIIISSLEFRMAEMEYIKLLGRLEFMVHEGAPEEDVREVAEQARELGEKLYGVPDETVCASALGEVWSQINDKELSPSAQQLYDDLHDGFMWNDREISPLPQPDEFAPLPDFNHPSLAWAGEIILEENADLEALFNEWWDNKVAEHGDDYVACPEDIAEAFKTALNYMDPENKAGVDVILDPDSSALSWESPLMAIKVGGKRAPITSAGLLFRRFLHEGKGHGGRAIEGLKTGLPVLGMGLYTDTARADYLTFEEGFCTTVEEAVSDKDIKWNGINLGYYINIALAQGGSDDRAVFETAWRYRLLMKVKDGQEVTEEMIEKEKNLTHTSLVRVFRGMPTGLSDKYPDIKPLTFNKDLAYLNGRVLAMNHIEELHERDDRDGLMRLFKAKYDPTIPEQQTIVDKYVS